MDTDRPPALDEDVFRPVVEGGRPLPPMAPDDDDGAAPGWAAELPLGAPAWLYDDDPPYDCCDGGPAGAPGMRMGPRGRGVGTPLGPIIGPEPAAAGAPGWP